jgi:outer membrane protein TolC
LIRSLAVAALLTLASPILAAPTGGETALTLDDALALAARQSSDLAIARADARMAAADRTASYAGVLPRLDLSAAFGHDFSGPRRRVETVPVTDAGGQPLIDPTTGQLRFREEIIDIPARDDEAYSLGLQLTQPIFDWRAFREVTRAGWNARAAERQYSETQLGLAFEVTRRFYEVVRAERSLAALEKTAARSKDLVARADALFTAGRTPRSETFTARSNLGNDLIAVERQRAFHAQARAALAQVLGVDGETELAVVAPATLDGGAAAAEPPPADVILAAARARRPALAAQQALVEGARAGVESARAAYFPTVDAQASYSRSGPQLAGGEGVYGDPSRQYFATAQVVLSWNLFEGRRTLAGVQRAEASVDRARAETERLLANVAREIADARSVATARSRQVVLAQDNLRTADQGLSLARERLDAGLATQLELRDASLNLTRAELALVEARIDHAVALADLARAAGGTL